MQQKIDKLQEDMYGIRAEINVMNTTQKTISDTLVEFKKIAITVHDLELKLAVNNTKIGTSERVIWLVITVSMGMMASYFKSLS